MANGNARKGSPVWQPGNLVRTNVRAHAVSFPGNLVTIEGDDDTSGPAHPTNLVQPDRPAPRLEISGEQRKKINRAVALGLDVAYATEHFAPGTLNPNAVSGWNPFSAAKNLGKRVLNAPTDIAVYATETALSAPGRIVRGAGRGLKRGFLPGGGGSRPGPAPAPDAPTPDAPAPDGSDASSDDSQGQYARGYNMATIAKLCAMGDPDACRIMRKLKIKADRGDARAARVYNGINQIKQNGLSGIMGHETGFIPLAAYAAEKYGPSAAKFVVRNKGKVAKANALVSKANKGDPNAKKQIAIINAGAKAGDPEAIQAKKAIKITGEHQAYHKSRLSWLKIMAD